MAPGWYDDPGGDRAVLRWWDGRSWTSVTRERAPSEAPAALPPADLLDSGPERRPADRRSWLVAGAVVVALIALVTVVLPRDRGTDPLAGQRPGAGPATVLPPEPTPTATRPVTGRITDRVAGLSYDVLPGEWREWDRESFSALRSTLGYYRITQQNAPNSQTYWANVNSGPVAPNVVAADGDLAATARRALTTLAGRYYPPHTRVGQAERRLTIDGAPAALVRYRAVFDRAAARGYAAKSEQIVVLVVDTGQELPSVLYVSLPDTVQDLWRSIDPLLASIRILR